MTAKTKELILNNVRKWFPHATIVHEYENQLDVECGYHEGNTFHCPDEDDLGSAIAELNKVFHAKGCSACMLIFGYDYSGYVPAGITFSLENIWDDGAINSRRMNCIVRSATRNDIPYDDLSKVNLYGELDRARYETEDGFGIEAKDIEFDFQVEAVEYRNCDISTDNPDDPEFEYYLVPCLWWYGGRIGEWEFEGLASTSNLAVGKAIKAVYRKAKLSGMTDVVKAIENNTVKWTRYGYCH